MSPLRSYFLIITLLILPAARHAAQAQEVRLYFAAVPAAQSGLDHVLNSDPKLGTVKYPWMSPPIDIDGDDNLDLLLYGHHGGGAMVFLGKGDGRFTFDASGYAKRWAFGGRDPIWLNLTGKPGADGIGTEGRGKVGWAFLNDGKGQWKKTNLSIPGLGIGGLQLIDADGDGYHREVFTSTSGAALEIHPAIPDWAASADKKLETKETWRAEALVGRPKGVEPGRGPGRAGFRDAYAVDLDGDHRNELILHFRGFGFTSKQLYSWVLQRVGKTWKDITTQRGLPTDEGHWLFPEDIDSDGHLDLVDLHSGRWYQNDGKGRFTLSKQRIFDPENRIGRVKKAHPWTTDNELQWLDLDNNGHRDLVTASDHGSQNGVFLNRGDGRFVEVKGISTRRRNRKFGDVNGDQRLDMIAFVKDRLVLHKNETPLAGVQVRLVPATPSDGALGAKVWAYEAGRLGDRKALVHYRQGFMLRDGGRSNVLVPDLHVGIGKRQAVDIRVRFPAGKIVEVRGVKAGTRIMLKE